MLPTGFRTFHFVSFLQVFFFSFLFLLFLFFSHYFVFVFLRFVFFFSYLFVTFLLFFFSFFFSVSFRFFCSFLSLQVPQPGCTWFNQLQFTPYVFWSCESAAIKMDRVFKWKLSSYFNTLGTRVKRSLKGKAELDQCDIHQCKMKWHITKSGLGS